MKWNDGHASFLGSFRAFERILFRSTNQRSWKNVGIKQGGKNNFSGKNSISENTNWKAKFLEVTEKFNEFDLVKICEAFKD